jgi:hypothetical protein
MRHCYFLEWVPQNGLLVGAASCSFLFNLNIYDYSTGANIILAPIAPVVPNPNAGIKLIFV